MKIPHLKIDESVIKSIDFDQTIINKAITAAAASNNTHDLEALTAGATYLEGDSAPAQAFTERISPSGAKFFIPLAVPEGVSSGDSRSFEEDSLGSRDLPLPLMWQIKTSQGHDGSVVVGRIDSIERVGNGLGNVRGVFDTGVFGREAERLVRGKFLRGVSVDLDQFSGVEEDDEKDLESSDTELSAKKSGRVIKNKKITVDNARLMGITIVAKPAFQECFITIEDEPTLSTNDDYIVEDGIYESMLDDMDSELAALAASAAPVIPPARWFEDQRLNGPTPLTITDDGQVFGHIAAWHVDHIGRHNVKPPHSASKYAYFRTGVVRTDDGRDVHVGQLTLAGGHAPLHASAAAAQKHYDDTKSAVADIRIYEDSYGIACAGALRPDVSPVQVRALRASVPSGDWRPINNRLELVAVCQVNVPGFPTVHTMVAGGQIQALVAAGSQPLAELKESMRENNLELRIKALELTEFAARRDAAINRMKDAQNEQQEKLKAVVASAESRMSNDLAAQETARNLLAEKVQKLIEKFNS